MDIYGLINSKAVENYLREIKYEFNSKEAAWLIYHSKKVPYEKKAEYWKELIETMPDCQIKERKGNEVGFDSLHKFLSDYIALIEAQYKVFRETDDDAIYSYSFYCAGDTSWCEEHGCSVFRTFDDCLKAIDGERKYNLQCYTIRKRFFDNSKRCEEVTYYRDNTIAEFGFYNMPDAEFDIINAFSTWWFSIPVPFKKGDIVYEPDWIYPSHLDTKGPFVLEGSIYPETVPFVREYGDETDMNAWGLFQDPDGRLFHEVMFNYIDLEYYEGPFEGVERLLKAVSAFWREEINLELLLATYRKVIIDEFAKDVMFTNWFLPEDMEKAGLVEEANRAKDRRGF